MAALLLADDDGDDAVDDVEADDADNVEPDESDRRPADVAKSLSFCESPTLGGFTAIEWCAIIDDESFDDDSNLNIYDIQVQVCACWKIENEMRNKK